MRKPRQKTRKSGPTKSQSSQRRSRQTLFSELPELSLFARSIHQICDWLVVLQGRTRAIFYQKLSLLKLDLKTRQLLMPHINVRNDKEKVLDLQLMATKNSFSRLAASTPHSSISARATRNKPRALRKCPSAFSLNITSISTAKSKLKNRTWDKIFCGLASWKTIHGQLFARHQSFLEHKANKSSILTIYQADRSGTRPSEKSAHHAAVDSNSSSAEHYKEPPEEK